ncbi:MAG: thioredoxin [Proteobacteria bacterium]|nr:thioredoxin [Pseudomonadota bacterium]
MKNSKVFSVFDSNFVEEVLKSKVPALVDVYLPKLPQNNIVSSYINGLTQRYSGRLKVAKINAIDNKIIIQKYKLKNFPTLILFQNGRQISQSVGANIGKMQEMINQLMTGLSSFSAQGHLSH